MGRDRALGRRRDLLGALRAERGRDRRLHALGGARLLPGIRVERELRHRGGRGGRGRHGIRPGRGRDLARLSRRSHGRKLLLEPRARVRPGALFPRGPAQAHDRDASTRADRRHDLRGHVRRGLAREPRADRRPFGARDRRVHHAEDALRPEAPRLFRNARACAPRAGTGCVGSPVGSGARRALGRPRGGDPSPRASGLCSVRAGVRRARVRGRRTLGVFAGYLDVRGTRHPPHASSLRPGRHGGRDRPRGRAVRAGTLLPGPFLAPRAPRLGVTRVVRLFAALGARSLVLTNAAGGISSRMTPGTLMLVEDQLNLQWQAPGRPGQGSPGDPRAAQGMGPSGPTNPRGLASRPVYSPDLLAKATRAAVNAGVHVERGILGVTLGPSYETPAEVAMLERMGADAVCMSTAAEVAAANEIGLPVACISCVTNWAAGKNPAYTARLKHDDVTTGVAAVAPALRSVIERLILALA